MEVWYDQIDANERTYKYEFTPPTKNGDMYMTVETYMYNIIPEPCTTGRKDGYLGNSPWVEFDVYHGDSNPYSYIWDIMHSPLRIKENEYTANELFDIRVRYDWYWSPAKDFTVKIYSKHDGTNLFDLTGNTNMLHTDGNEPSEFTYVPPAVVPDDGTDLDELVDVWNSFSVVVQVVFIGAAIGLVCYIYFFMEV